MALRIGFDATAAVRQAAGIGRYTRELLTALVQLPGEEKYRVFYASRGTPSAEGLPRSERIRTVSIPVSDRVLNAVWQRAHVPFPVQTFTGPIDVFHSPDFTLPFTLRTPRVVTIHDLAFLRLPECAYPTLRDYLQRVVPRSARLARRIIAVSEHTRQDVIELLDIPSERVVTIHEAASGHFGAPPDRASARRTVQELGVTGPFILAVGTLEPRKNYVRLFEAYRLLHDRGLHPRLVVAGRPGWLYHPILKRRKELRLETRIQIVEANDSQLAALYGLCEAFVYPSLYEGFGIPPLEALTAGAPVACSNSSSLPEVVGDAAITFDPLHVDDIAAALERILTDSGLRAELQAGGPAQASKFSWAGTADKTARLYHEIADG